MSRTWMKVIGVIVVLACAIYGGVWLLAQRTIPLSVSAADHAAALNKAEETLALGPEPGNWPVRLFMPADAFQDISGAVVGTKYQFPFGDVGPNGPEGYIVANVRKLEFTPGDLLLRARVDMEITYLPVRKNPWWGNAAIQFTGKADILPLREQRGDAGMLYFRLVPTGLSPRVRWGPINLAAQEMLSQVIASHVLDRIGRDLLVPIPALKVPIDINSGMVVTHEGAFPVDGGYRLTAQLDGRSLHSEISTDRLLVVSSGVWLLGGLPDKPDAQAVQPNDGSPAELERRLLALKAQLAPFDRKSGNAEAHIPIAPVLALAEAAAAPDNGANGPTDTPRAASNYNVRIAITEATGILFKTQLASNRIVGDVDLTVSPASRDFASGRISFSPPQLQWQKGVGLTGRLDATVDGEADFRANLTGSPAGLATGANLGLSGSTKTSFPFSLGLKHVTEAEGSAIFLVPDVGCTRVALDLHQNSGGGSLFPAAWYKLNSMGVRIERNFGGGAPGSVALIDSKPRYVPFPADGPLANGITYPSDGVAITTSPKGLVIGEDGIDVAVSIQARAASRADEAGFMSDRAALLATLKKKLPARSCAPDQRFRLLL